jgi:acyl carrier protein
MAESTEAKVKEIIINELGVEPEKVTPEASFV